MVKYIKDITLVKEDENDHLPCLDIKYDDLTANIFDNGRYFCATSFDSEWCCTGVILDYKDTNNQNPMLRIFNIYTKLIKEEMHII